MWTPYIWEDLSSSRVVLNLTVSLMGLGPTKKVLALGFKTVLKLGATPSMVGVDTYDKT